MSMTLKEIKRKALRIFKTKSQAIEYISKFGFRSNETLQISRYKSKWLVMYIDYKKDIIEKVEEIEVEEDE